MSSELQTDAERAWQDYCELREKAERSRAIKDGIAAGKAWGRFLSEFEPIEQSERPS